MKLAFSLALAVPALLSVNPAYADDPKIDALRKVADQYKATIEEQSMHGVIVHLPDNMPSLPGFCGGFVL
ncbi:hypothetical protein [Bradyrhizobium sp. SZCCHNS1054]|uniref:hypothetical protein n=1 Tax=Bradyrhizobium sp. SZCCHNS1054 TaxID=3057301 RepID=UPI002915F213|nr:hypothetical protein [Bradyrhizobium sp. SZCCHNS1054]